MRAGRVAAFCLSLACAPAALSEPTPGDGWSAAGFAGVMTDNAWEEVLLPWQVDPVRSGLAGIALRRDWALAGGQVSLGVEGQAVLHFGTNEHLELNLPVVATWRPRDTWSGPVDSLAFGLGLSWASDPPRVEIDRDGDSQRLLFYWMAEIGTQGPAEGSELFLRLHHRSDGFGAFDVDAGSNAIVLGYRRRF